MGLDMLIMRGSYRSKGLFAGPFCDLPSHCALVTPARGRKAGASRHWLKPSRTRNRFITSSKVVVFSPLLHHICGGVLSGPDSPSFRQQILEMRGRLPLR